MGSGGSAGVIAMMDLLVQDLDKDMTESSTEEKNAKAEYEQLMVDSADKRRQDSKSLVDKQSAKADLQGALEASQGKKTIAETAAVDMQKVEGCVEVIPPADLSPRDLDGDLTEKATVERNADAALPIPIPEMAATAYKEQAGDGHGVTTTMDILVHDLDRNLTESATLPQRVHEEKDFASGKCIQ